MLKKIKNIISRIDLFLFKIFGSEKNVKFLENLKEAKVIFSCINEIGQETKVRFVGGCVRKTLCAEKVDDIDLATTLEPNEMKKGSVLFMTNLTPHASFNNSSCFLLSSLSSSSSVILS